MQLTPPVAGSQSPLPDRFYGLRQDRPEGLRILVVEDDADTAESLAVLLGLYGHQVQVVRTGPGALEVANTHPPDVVLLDIGLPRMDGYEVARQLLKPLGLAKPFLIAITGYGQAADRRRSKEAGINLHLMKPADPDELQKVLERINASRKDSAQPVCEHAFRGTGQHCFAP